MLNVGCISTFIIKYLLLIIIIIILIIFVIATIIGQNCNVAN